MRLVIEISMLDPLRSSKSDKSCSKLAKERFSGLNMAIVSVFAA
jgi:hypothetical protein